MGAVVPIVSAIVGVAGAVQQYQAGQEAKDLAKQNAARARAESQEEIRRQTLANQQVEGMAAARAAASGGKMTGTISSYLDRLKEENLKDIDWMRRSGSSMAQLEAKKGSIAKSQATAGAMGSLAGAASSFYSGGQSAGWWK